MSGDHAKFNELVAARDQARRGPTRALVVLTFADSGGSARPVEASLSGHLSPIEPDRTAREAAAIVDEI